MTEQERAALEQQTDEGRWESYLQTGSDNEPFELLPDDFSDETDETYEWKPRNTPKSRTKSRKMSRPMKKLLYIAGVLLASFLLALFAWNCAEDLFALSKPDRDVQVVIKEDDSLGDVVNLLAEEGLIEYKWLFRIYCGLANADEKISPGTYVLNNVYDYNALVNGLRAYSETRETVTVTIPEGYTCKQIFETLEENGVCSVDALETTAESYIFDYDFLQDVAYGEGNRLEGYLFPDTYEFYVDDDPERVLSKFLSNFSWKITEELQADIDTLNKDLAVKMEANGFSASEIQENKIDLNDVIIIASLVERESGGTSESSLIASVIYNRLSSKVYPLLEIDASVRYGLDKWEGDLTMEDLASDTRYNTRKYPGLPVGPISNPGIDSIRAAIYPRDTDYYFYVLTSTGFHHFSENYYEHQDYIEEMNNDSN